MAGRGILAERKQRDMTRSIKRTRNTANRTNALDVQKLANKGTIGAANVRGGYGLAERKLANRGNLNIADVQNKGAIAKQNLVNKGAIDTTGVRGKYGLAERKLANEGNANVAGIQNEGALNKQKLTNKGRLDVVSTQEAGAGGRLQKTLAQRVREGDENRMMDFAKMGEESQNAYVRGKPYYGGLAKKFQDTQAELDKIDKTFGDMGQDYIDTMKSNLYQGLDPDLQRMMGTGFADKYGGE